MANWRDVEVVLAARGLTRDESADLLDVMGQDGKQVRPLNRFSDFRLRLRDGGPLVRTNSGEYYLMGIDAPNWSRPLTIDELGTIDIPAQEWSGWDTQHLWVGVDGISAAASALSKSKAGKPRAVQASKDNGAKGGRPKSEGLTPLQQRAYDLRLQGLKIKDIAQQMGRQPESIRQLLARAATKLNIPGGWTETARKG